MKYKIRGEMTMRIKHTKDSLKLYEFLERHSNKWHSIAKDKRTWNAFSRLQDLYGTDVMEFDGFTNQGRYVPDKIGDAMLRAI